MPEQADVWKAGPSRWGYNDTRVVFAQVREDVALESSLARGRALCIASGGDTAFGLLLGGAKRVTAVDVNPAQLYLVELKLAAIERLDYADLVAAVVSDARPAYRRLREALSGPASVYFDANENDLRIGLQNCGVVDRAIAKAMRVFQRLIHRRETVESMLSQPTLDAQRTFHRDRWDTWKWRAANNIAHTRFAYTAAYGSRFGSAVPRGFARVMRRNMDVTLADVPVARNAYVWQTLLGHYPPGGGPDWLSKANVASLRQRRTDLTLSQDDLATALTKAESDRFDVVCLSNALDGAPAGYVDLLASAIAFGAAPGAKVVHRSLLEKPSGLGSASREVLQLVPTPAWTDRSFFCRYVELFEVTSS